MNRNGPPIRDDISYDASLTILGQAVIYIFGSYLRLSSHAWRFMYVRQQEGER